MRRPFYVYRRPADYPRLKRLLVVLHPFAASGTGQTGSLTISGYGQQSSTLATYAQSSKTLTGYGQQSVTLESP